MSNKEYLLKTQGYYYLVKTTWKTEPGKNLVTVSEYGNKASALKAAYHWNTMPDCDATIEKRYK